MPSSPESSPEGRDRYLDWEETGLEVDVLDEEDPDNSEGLLDNLDEAQDASIARKRSFQQTATDKLDDSAKRTWVAHGHSTKVDVSPSRRVSEFPGEHLVADCGKLDCLACHTEISLKRSIIRLHLLTNCHIKGKAQFAKEEERQQLVKQSFLAYQECLRAEKRLAGTGMTEAVSTDVSLRRIEVVRSMMLSGLPLAKVDVLRPLLENGGALRLTYFSHMAQYIPFILEEGEKYLKAELPKAQFLSVVFDGSTHLGEALAILVRYIDADWKLQQQLVRLHVLSKSLNGQQLARELITYLSVKYNIHPKKLVTAIRDGAAVNGAALWSVKDIMFPICVMSFALHIHLIMLERNSRRRF